LVQDKEILGRRGKKSRSTREGKKISTPQKVGSETWRSIKNICSEKIMSFAIKGKKMVPRLEKPFLRFKPEEERKIQLFFAKISFV